MPYVCQYCCTLLYYIRFIFWSDAIIGEVLDMFKSQDVPYTAVYTGLKPSMVSPHFFLLFTSMLFTDAFTQIRKITRTKLVCTAHCSLTCSFSFDSINSQQLWRTPPPPPPKKKVFLVICPSFVGDWGDPSNGRTFCGPITTSGTARVTCETSTCRQQHSGAALHHAVGRHSPR